MAEDVEKIRAMAARVAASEGLTLVDLEVKGGRANRLLRIYIHKPSGVSHEDCQTMSEQMSALLDVEDPFPGPYTLEVSSPGLDRILTKPSEFEIFAGRRARLILRNALDGPKILEGRLAGFERGRVLLDIGSGEVRNYDLADISKAKLVPES